MFGLSRQEFLTKLRDHFPHGTIKVFDCTNPHAQGRKEFTETSSFFGPITSISVTNRKLLAVDYAGQTIFLDPKRADFSDDDGVLQTEVHTSTGIYRICLYPS